MGKVKPYTKEEVLKAIEGCSTITSTVAKRLGCNWATARKYINKWSETKIAYENERQTIGDFAEGKLIENIKKGDMGAIKYFLSKKYKDRGYGDEEGLNSSDGNDGNDGTFRIVDESPLRACDTGEFDD